MILPRTKGINKIPPIKRPRWKQRVVGIASYHVKEENEIEIAAVSPKDGKRYYPNQFYATGEQIRSCPTQMLDSGVKLYLVPIADLEVLERE